MLFRSSARIRFLDDFSADFPSLYSSFDFLVGDWNMVPDPLQDRVTASTSRYCNTWSHFSSCLSSFFDAAYNGASEPFFTYHATGHNMQARLDHVFAHLRHSSFTLDTSLIPYAYSDHSALVVSFTDTSPSPHLLYRLNTSLLSSPELQAATTPYLRPIRSPSHWDFIKDAARSTARDYAVVVSRHRLSDLRALERQLAQARHHAAHNLADDAAAARVAVLRDQLDSVTSAATSRAILRARVRWLEEGETCSAYFFSRFRSRPDQSSTSLLRDASGLRFSSSDTRRQHIKEYYTRVYACPPVDTAACDSFLSSVSLPRISSDDIDSLLTPFTSDELSAAIRALPARRAPGPDGIPYEWYQTFSDELAPLLLPFFNSILAGSPPPFSWSRTLISLIPKPNRDLADIANWRPITLSNCDVKIFSRMLTTRLAAIMPSLIDPAQAGFIKGRQAADVAMVLKTVLTHAHDHDVPGALVFLDQEKAYDRISYSYLFAVLSRFGFPSSLHHAFAATFHNSFTFLLDDGHPVGPIPVGCGVRQGDPLAPLLFNLCFEPLLVAMRVRLQGIQLPWGFYRTSAFADDSGYGLHPDDAPVFRSTLDQYCAASNARVNYHKSTYVSLQPDESVPS